MVKYTSEDFIEGAELKKVSRDGAIIIPKDVRENLGVKPGDWVLVEVTGGSSISISKAHVVK